MKALIYTRVSEDRAGGRSPAEQEADARAVCEREGWEVVGVATDSVGASRHSKGKRGGWEQAKKVVAAGDVDVLVTWEASRAQRDLAAYASLRELCAKNGVLWNYSGRTHDLSTKDDRFKTGLDALLAERESDEISDRVCRAMRANAVKGRPHGRRLFGYQRVYDPTSGALVTQEPHPDEADLVRRIFRDYLAGNGVRTLARTLNEEGLVTAAGAKWSDTTVHGLLRNPGYAARRVHRGKVVGEATWPALVDDDTFDRTQVRLDNQRTYAPRGAARTRLLTGIARCGICGGKMGALHDRNYRKVYACKVGYCVTRDMTKLDAFVSAVIVDRLERPDVAEALRDSTGDEAAGEAERRVFALKAQLDNAVDEFASGRLSAATLGKVEQRLLPQIAEAEAESRRALLPLSIEVPTKAVEAWWGSLSDEVRRELVQTLLGAVVVLPASKRGARVFDPTAIRVEWRR